MASGDLIVKVADKDTLDRTYANTNAILAAVGELRCGLLEFEQFCGQCELEHRCVQFLLISERLIKCSLYPTPQGENHSGYRVG